MCYQQLQFWQIPYKYNYRSLSKTKSFYYYSIVDMQYLCIFRSTLISYVHLCQYQRIHCMTILTVRQYINIQMHTASWMLYFDWATNEWNKFATHFFFVVREHTKGNIFLNTSWIIELKRTHIFLLRRNISTKHNFVFKISSFNMHVQRFCRIIFFDFFFLHWRSYVISTDCIHML